MTLSNDSPIALNDLKINFLDDSERSSVSLEHLKIDKIVIEESIFSPFLKVKIHFSDLAFGSSLFNGNEIIYFSISMINEDYDFDIPKDFYLRVASVGPEIRKETHKSYVVECYPEKHFEILNCSYTQNLGKSSNEILNKILTLGGNTLYEIDLQQNDIIFTENFFGAGFNGYDVIKNYLKLLPQNLFYFYQDREKYYFKSLEQMKKDSNNITFYQSKVVTDNNLFKIQKQDLITKISVKSPGFNLNNFLSQNGLQEKTINFNITDKTENILEKKYNTISENLSNNLKNIKIYPERLANKNSEVVSFKPHYNPSIIDQHNLTNYEKQLQSYFFNKTKIELLQTNILFNKELFIGKLVNLVYNTWHSSDTKDIPQEDLIMNGDYVLTEITHEFVFDGNKNHMGRPVQNGNNIYNRKMICQRMGRNTL